MREIRIGLLATALGAAYAVAGAASDLAPAGSRALASTCLIATLSMTAAAFVKRRPRETVAATAAATAAALVALRCRRRWFDPTAVVGPVPPSLEVAALVALGVVNVAASALIAAVFSAGGRVSRFRRVVLGATAASSVAFCVATARRIEGADSRQALLRRVVALERSPDRIGWAERQELSAALTVLGRRREALEIPLVPEVGGRGPRDATVARDPEPPLVATPWRDAVSKIAAERRLVLIMEAHAATEDREWIERTLGTFRAAGFSHYSAEAITEPVAILKSRGHPTSRTGTYTLDPRFGNLVRTALRLGFEVGGHDLADGDFESREESQAAVLARRFASRPGVRMVVHAGHGHVLKHEVRHVGRYMAARLWAMTGVEPFTIWQSSETRPDDGYRDLVRRIGPIAEPVMLVPPPRDVSERLFPESSTHPAVDAVVIHPPRLGREPTDRRGAFADGLTRVAGAWRGGRWPVVIAAVPAGESDEAIALDQVMLRPGETDFELWLPRADHVVRVWGLDGPLDVDASADPTRSRLVISN